MSAASYLDRLRLDGRTVVLFGATGGGMGTQTALAIADAGATLIAADISAQRLEETRALVEERGGACIPIVADVREGADVLAAIEAAITETGRLDGVVNLVGGGRVEGKTGTLSDASSWRPVEDYDYAVYEELFRLNMHYVFRSCQAAARRMIEGGRGGAIVNFASVSALAGAPYCSAYGAAKAGVMSLTRTLAAELGRHNIRANCIVPGSVPTQLARRASAETFDQITDRASNRSPLGRRVDPAEIAGAVLFFLSDLSSGITGQCLNVDAGVSANSPLGTHLDYAETTRIRHAHSAN